MIYMNVGNILTDRNGEIVSEHRLKSANEMIVNRKNYIKIYIAIAVVSYIVTFIVLRFLGGENVTPASAALISLPGFPGVMCVLIGIFVCTPYVRNNYELEYPKERLTATVSNTYKITEENVERRDGKNTVTYSNRYFTVFDCYYGGVHYVLERKSSVPEIKGKKPKINDKKIMLFDKNEPERSLLEEDIEAVKGISSGIFLIILGIFWAGMLFLSMITNK